MGRAITIVLICTALGGCGNYGSVASIATITGDKPATPAAPPAPPAAAQPAPAPEKSSFSMGGVWDSISSPFSSSTPPPAPQTPPAKVYGQPFEAGDALRLVNDYRASKNLAPLSLDPKVTAAAQALAKDMAKHDRMSAKGHDMGKRLTAAGYSFQLAAENAAAGQPSVDEAFESWKSGAADSRNMLLPEAKHIGIGYEYRPGSSHKTFWVLVVAAP